MQDKYPLSVAMTDFVKQSLSFFPANVIDQGIVAQRLAYNAMTEHFASQGSETGISAVADGLEITEQTLAGVKIRRYQTAQSNSALQVLFAHGGGWYLGGLDSHNSFCAYLASQCHINVTAIDYSLAPESPYPAGLDDIECVYRALIKQDSTPVLLMGDSAGGNLMAGLTLRCRRKGIAPALALGLIYPALSKPNSLPSHQDLYDAPLLDTQSLEFCWQQYTASVDQPENQPAVQSDSIVEDILPLAAESHHDLPKTMIFAAQYDPLVDDARYYQQALLACGVEAKLSIIDGLVHGALHGFRGTEEGQQLVTEICDYVRLLNTN